MQTKQHPFVLLLLQVSLFILECESSNTWTQIWFDNGEMQSYWSDSSIPSSTSGSTNFGSLGPVALDDQNVGWIRHRVSFGDVRSIYRATNIAGYSQLRLSFDCAVEASGDSSASCSIHYSYNSLYEQILMSTIYPKTTTSYIAYNQTLSFPPIRQNSTLWLWLQAESGNYGFVLDCYWDNIYLYGSHANDETGSFSPTNDPTFYPSNAPTTITITSVAPSILPSSDPSNNPTKAPTEQPSFEASISQTSPFTDSTSFLPQFATSVATHTLLPSNTEMISIEIDTKQVKRTLPQAIIIASVCVLVTIIVIIVIIAMRSKKRNKQEKMTEMTANEKLIMRWLIEDVHLPQYYDNLVSNGYDSLAIMQNISKCSHLEEIGISLVGHQTRILAKLSLLDKSNEEISINANDDKENELKHANNYAIEPGQYHVNDATEVAIVAVVNNSVPKHVQRVSGSDIDLVYPAIITKDGGSDKDGDNAAYGDEGSVVNTDDEGQTDSDHQNKPGFETTARCKQIKKTRDTHK